MQLFLIRHADAGPRDEDPVKDQNRPLSPEGRQQAENLAKKLRDRHILIPIILSSPLPRARQTAEEMLKQEPEPGVELRMSEELIPGAKRRKLLRSLQEIGGETLAVVGHQPDLTRFAGWLIGCKKAQLDLAKGGFARIDFDAGLSKGAGTLVWLEG